MNGRIWTEAELQYLRSHYRQDGCREIAAHLGRSRSSTYQKASQMGLVNHRPDIYGEDFQQFIRDQHAIGRSDTEIAKAWGDKHNHKMDRHTVSDRRRKLGLPLNVHSEHQRRKVAKKTKEQCEAAGVESLAEIRRLAFRDYSERNGWPADLRPRGVQILNLLYDFGPKTRREICEALGMPWKGSRKSLASNDPEGSYLAHLAARGLVTAIKRARRVIGKGSGRSQNLYVIPITIKRGEPSTWPEKKKTNSLISTDPPLPEEQTMQAALRAAVFNGVSESDVADIVKGIVQRAKDGDKDAMKYFFDYILGGKSNVHAVQNNYYNGDPPSPDDPIDSPPGSPDRVAAMSERFQNGRAIFHDDDKADFE